MAIAFTADGLLAVTSADRLNEGWPAAQRARERSLARHSRTWHRSRRMNVRTWPIATFRGDAAIQSLSELSGHSASHAWIAAAIHDAWSFWV
jgi:hypothetical protein